MKKSLAQRGNILFLILLAVVLFAALSYAVTSSMNGGGKDGGAENAEAAAADIMGWFAQMDQGIQRMMLMNNVPVEQVDFTDSTNKMQDGNTDTANNTVCATSSCEVYNPAGGNLTPRKFEQYADQTADLGESDKRKPGHMMYMVMNVKNLRTTANEVAVRVNYIKLDVCKAINRRSGLAECPAIGQSGTLYTYNGNVTPKLAASDPYSYDHANINGQATFCSCSGTYGSVFHVFVER